MATRRNDEDGVVVDTVVPDGGPPPARLRPLMSASDAGG